MATQTVELSGDALVGIHTDGEPYRLAVAALPATVKLGRRPPRPEVKAARPHLAAFMDLNLRAQTLPPSTDWRTRAALAIARTYLNDQYGDCVWASNMHLLGVTSANDSDSAGIVQATDQEVLSQYQGVCGPGDNGCVITDTLDYGMRTGWTAGGKVYKIPGYAAVDWTAWDLCRACCADFGGFKIGINLPQAWTTAATWDVTNTAIVGGHDVYVIDYDADYLYLSSWGRIYRLTKAAALSTRWLEEAYVVLSPVWTGPDKKAPSGYDVAGLTAAMAALHGGHLPDGPTPPPTPPTPSGNFNLQFSALCGPDHKVIGATYTITPVKSADHVYEMVAAFALAKPGFSIPPAILEWLGKEEAVVADVLVHDIPLVFIGLKTWDQVLVDVEAAVAAGSFPAGR